MASKGENKVLKRLAAPKSRALLRNPKVRLTAVADLKQENLEQAKAEFNLQATYKDYEKMFETMDSKWMWEYARKRTANKIEVFSIAIIGIFFKLDTILIIASS